MKAKLTIGIALFLLGGAFHVFAQATAYANIYACVVAPVGIAKTADLRFSDVIIPVNTNKIESTNGAGMQIAQTGTYTMATFSVSGKDNLTFDITLPTENLTIGNGTSQSFVVSSFNSSQSMNSSLQGINREIKVGATLFASGNQSVNTNNIQNTFPVTLNYN